jgi:hypothetical protein
MRELTKNQWFSDQFFDILVIFLRTVFIDQNLFFKYLENQWVSGYIFALIINGPHSESHPTLVVTGMG